MGLGVLAFGVLEDYSSRGLGFRVLGVYWTLFHDAFESVGSTMKSIYGRMGCEM